MRIISDKFFFYTKTSDKLTHEIVDYFNSNQGNKVINIVGRSITRNGFIRFPLACYPKLITILQNFCMEKNIELIYTDDYIDSKGEGLSKLIELFSKDNIDGDSTKFSA